MRLSVRQLFTAILFTGIFIMTVRPIADPDFWWHLRTGQLISEMRQVPHNDPFSFTRAGEAWVAHEWLTELGLYSLYRLGGLPLLILVFSLIMTGSYVLTYATCTDASRPYAAGFALLLGSLASAPAWGVRPQMLSLLLFALVLVLMERFRQTRRLGFLIPLPFLTALWVNLHAGYFLIFAAVGFFLLGEVIELFVAWRRGEKRSARPVLALGAALAASVPAALANPNGAHILTYPFETLTSPSMQQFIQEWFSPDFHRAEWQPLAWFILALIGGSLLGRRPVPAARLLLSLFLGYAALRSMRNVPLFALAAIPVLAEQMAPLFGPQASVRGAPRLARWLGTLIICLAGVTAGLQFIATAASQADAERKVFPVKAADWISQNRSGGRLYNTYGWGGYLIWRLYPQFLVYIDGRADLYGDEFIYGYLRTYHAQPGWQEALEAARIDIVVIENGEPLDLALAESSLWEKAFADEASVVFVKAQGPQP
jgi:hypothetical protein